MGVHENVLREAEAKAFIEKWNHLVEYFDQMFCSVQTVSQLKMPAIS